ncbi:hypothetical protein F4V57_06000 [Acinetobacter qingfengensis]|uniref:Uncharacterized protein n=1 Tax=Acinetobacter qingfengensis TaxID=1262585 RepID=A0A1E7REG2_9GAMM|nr:hypothetical protein [Acinetobacter qingfengensis]KAA8734509.1 hypothetical protein F4V57_06000 [Acinetobacter qingfengensis]OEY97545.1 hypothetical protein BJI46_09330 [Acinetobacter qingfengensis]
MSQRIIQRIGETDQFYLKKNTPELALERGDLRLQLVTLSHNRQEQIHFLHEAIVILEQSRLEFDEIPLQLYLDLSLQLGRAYMMYYELTRDTKFATITQQILKPLAHYQDGDLLFLLAYACAVKSEFAMTKHWLQKYVRSPVFDFALLQNHTAFQHLQSQQWFAGLLKGKLH